MILFILKFRKRIKSFDILSQILPPISLKYAQMVLLIQDKENFQSILLKLKWKILRGQLKKVLGSVLLEVFYNRICNDFGNMKLLTL